MIKEAITIDGSNNAERNPENKSNQKRRQGKFEGIGGGGRDLVINRCAGLKRAAEVTMQNTYE